MLFSALKLNNCFSDLEKTNHEKDKKKVRYTKIDASISAGLSLFSLVSLSLTGILHKLDDSEVKK